MARKKSDADKWIDGRKFVQGEIYWADDKYVSETLKEAFGLKEKNRRPVLVVQGDSANSVARMPVIIVAPLSVSGRELGMDYRLPARAGGLKKDSVVQLSLIGPVPKKALEEHIGTVPSKHMEMIRVRIAQKFGLIEEDD